MCTNMDVILQPRFFNHETPLVDLASIVPVLKVRIAPQLPSNASVLGLIYSQRLPLLQDAKGGSIVREIV